MKQAKRWFWFFFIIFVLAHFIPFIWVRNSSVTVECSGLNLFIEAFPEDQFFREQPVRTVLQVMTFCIIFVGVLVLSLCFLQMKGVRVLAYTMLHKNSLDNSLLLIILVMIGIGLFERANSVEMERLLGFQLWAFSCLGMAIANRWLGLKDGDIPEIGLEIHLVE
ncbi:MAG: hypothetical protein GY810_06045 [Aureispira sp.]|nr:hypothetical protein [Aureispira sp.]